MRAQAGELEPLRARDASVVRVSTARLNVTHYGGARLSVMRDVIDRPEPQSEVDCAPLARWDRAGRACRMWNAVSRGEQPSAAWPAAGSQKADSRWRLPPRAPC